MNETLFTRHASTLRAIIEGTGVSSLADMVRRPGTRSVYRLTVHHHDGRARDSVATLIDHGQEGVKLEVVFRVTFAGKPLVYPVTTPRYEAFVRAVQSLRFDHLADQADLPPYGADLWLLERAAGSFTRSVVIAPALADGPYAVLVACVKTYLPEALREVR
jgi:hypothetical protein